MVDILVVNLPVIKLLRNHVMHFPPQVWGQFRTRVFQAAVIQDAVKMDSRRVKVGS